MRALKMRSWLEVFSNLAIIVVAAAVFWRVVLAPVGAGGGRASDLQAVEDTRSKNLVVRLDTAARIGNADSKIVLIEFSDFECPFCGRYARDTFDRLQKEFVATHRIQYAFLNFPLEMIHKSAASAAQATECAGMQGKYWEMHRALFKHQAELAQSIWVREAERLELDMIAFSGCMEGPIPEKIKADITQGRDLGVRSTPTFLIAEKQADGSARVLSIIRGAQPYDVFRDELAEVLGRPS